MKQFLRLIIYTIFCLAHTMGCHIDEPSSVSLLPKNATSFDRFVKKNQDEKLKEEPKKRGEVPVKQEQQKPIPVKPTPVNKPINSPIKPSSPKPINWTDRLPIARLLIGCSAGALAAYLVDQAIFSGDYTAEIALERENLRDYIAKRRDLCDKTECEAEYAELTALIKATRTHLTELKALKRARTIIVPLVIVTTIAASTLTAAKK